jgi:NAD(P)-dependent dehydrogenase (short-subunit alcohol dehydrogenase family)
MRPELRGKVALVTGGTRGIGNAVAAALAARGCTVVVAARRLPAHRPPTHISFYECDVRAAGSVVALFVHVRKKFRRLDVLVNNAGVSHSMAHVQSLPPEQWDEVIATNLTGLFHVTRAALPLMRRGATIVNNLSIAATRSFAGQAAYCASKHGALGFTRVLRDEVRHRGIRVIALLAGATDTEIWNQFWPEAPRNAMLRPATVAQSVVDAILLPPRSTVEEITLMPTAGEL